MRVLLCALFLLVPVSAMAQTHPCDQPAPLNPVIQSGAPHKVTFCSPATDNVAAVKVTVDGQAFDSLAATPITGPSLNGQVQYETPAFLQVSRGDHSLTAATYNRDQFTGQLRLGPTSAPFGFAAVDSTPLTTAPRIMGVSR
jgi:hypothetical protein